LLTKRGEERGDDRDTFKKRQRAELRQDLALVAEAYAADDFFNQIAKRSAARQRPFVHFMSASDQLLHGSDKDANASFYSGHTSGAFAMAVSLYTSRRLRHDVDAARALKIGLPLAAATAYLRIAADRHYASDVLVAAGAGSFFGWLVPQLHRARLPIQPSAAVSSTSRAVFFTWTGPVQ